MTGLITILIIVLITIIVVQIARMTEIAARIRGEEEVEEKDNNRTGVYLLLFMIAFLLFCFISAYLFKDRMMGYGPHGAASKHGSQLDSIFNITLFWTGIVFLLTHVYLFWFSYKYRKKKGVKAYYFPHSTKLEIIWTVVPTFVLVFLVVKGLSIWNNVMYDVDPEEEFIEIEAVGYQFAWDLRYPGDDGILGKRDYRLIDLASNPLGQDWADPRNFDDFLPTEIVLPKGKKVRVRINSKDVLHNFYLPHFRVKMDAVPGLPTYFVFTPIKTTEDYRQELRNYEEWNELSDPSDPESNKMWEEFNYELACAELCGKGHFSMRRLVKIVEPAEYEEWLAGQQSYYMTNIRNTEKDPYAGKLLDSEILDRERELESVLDTITEGGKISLQLQNIFFPEGSSELEENSGNELNMIAKKLRDKEHWDIVVNAFADEASSALMQARAESVAQHLRNEGLTGVSVASPEISDTTEVAGSKEARSGLIILKITTK